MEAKLLSEGCSIIEKAQVLSSLGLAKHETAAEASIFQLFFSGRRLSQGGIRLLRSTCPLRPATSSARRSCRSRWFGCRGS